MEVARRKDIGQIDELCRRPGFVTVLDDQHLAVPDATGNRRLDTTLRVNGRAVVTAAPEVLERLTPLGKPPKTAIVVEAEEVYTHCSWPDPATLPTSAEVSLAHQRNPELTLEQVQGRERESLAKRLD